MVGGKARTRTQASCPLHPFQLGPLSRRRGKTKASHAIWNPLWVSMILVISAISLGWRAKTKIQSPLSVHPCISQMFCQIFTNRSTNSRAPGMYQDLYQNAITCNPQGAWNLFYNYLKKKKRDSATWPRSYSKCQNQDSNSALPNSETFFLYILPHSWCAEAFGCWRLSELELVPTGEGNPMTGQTPYPTGLSGHTREASTHDSPLSCVTSFPHCILRTKELHSQG